MPGRNDACPCGSGKKYKKCCLETETNQRRQGQQAHLITALFSDAADDVHHAAIRSVGIPALQEWSAPMIDGAAEWEVDFFREFSVFHLPFRGHSCLAAWMLQQSLKVDPTVRQVLELGMKEPYSYWLWESTEPDGRPRVRDLLCGKRRTVLPASHLSDGVGTVVFGKVVAWEGVDLIASSCTYSLPREAAEELAKTVLEGRKSWKKHELLAPDLAGMAYAGWFDTVESWHELDAEYDLDSRAFHNLTFGFDRRQRNWVLQGFEQSPLFEAHTTGVYLYPNAPNVEAVIEVLDDEVVVKGLRVRDLSALEQEIERANGALLTLVDRQSVRLVDHFLQHGANVPVFPGMPSLAEMFPNIEESGFLEELASYVDSRSRGPSIEDVLESFLDDRAVSVGRTTFDRDEDFIRLFKAYIFVDAQGGDLASPHPQEYLETTGYRKLLSSVSGFVDYITDIRRVPSPTLSGKLRTSLRVFLRWMTQQELLKKAEFGEFEVLLKESSSQ